MTTEVLTPSITGNPALKDIISGLRREYKPLEARIKSVPHSVVCECMGITIRVHHPAIQNGECTTKDLADVISLYLAQFALSRHELNKVDEKYGKISSQDFMILTNRLMQKATRLLKRAHIETNRNGEAGELLLYLLTDWILKAPQILAKMSLNTNREMPVHGSDGVHIRFCEETKRLIFYWGESKIYSDINKGVTEAIKSIAEALNPEKVMHEIDLVERNLPLAGLSAKEQDAILNHLNPFEDDSNERINVTTCLIAFDFHSFAALKGLKNDAALNTLKSEVEATLKNISVDISAKIKKQTSKITR